jgi:hypothetical protein
MLSHSDEPLKFVKEWDFLPSCTRNMCKFKTRLCTISHPCIQIFRCCTAFINPLLIDVINRRNTLLSTLSIVNINPFRERERGGGVARYSREVYEVMSVFC